MVLIKTVLGFGFVGLSMIFLAPFGLVLCMLDLLGMKKIARAATYAIAQNWARLVIFITGSTVTARGTENIPKTGGFCIISNHRSIFDIVVHLASAGRAFGFIAKKELALIPFLNMWIILIGGLFIDRNNPRKALRAIESGAKKIAAGGGMIIFPEGTRNKTDAALLPFRPGSFKLATESRSVLIPAAVTGSRDVFEATGQVRSATITVSYAAPIDTSTLDANERRRHLSENVHETVSALLAEADS